ncbi:MAG: MerR family transcriptional regulator [Acidimicrobiia bacterium]|nr:MerR family transcriptional regulator [Acidimicrobiia bacterium]MDH5238303.1 MerR family transcriptional regulator [Acidimicrobiia bacterium]
MTDVSDVSDRPRRSIGDVLAVLQGEFPDISISKIRYLESQGLVAPARARSGYRQFDDDDIAMLRWVLHQQRDHFLPLRVIRDRLARGEAGEGDDPPKVGRRRSGAALPAIDATVSLDATELARAAGLTEEDVAALESYGLIRSGHGGGQKRYDGAALLMAHLAARFAQLGVEPRHLRMFKVAADREAGVIDQLVAPLAGSRDDAGERVRELVELGAEVRRLLLGNNLRDHL